MPDFRLGILHGLMLLFCSSQPHRPMWTAPAFPARQFSVSDAPPRVSLAAGHANEPHHLRRDRSDHSPTEQSGAELNRPALVQRARPRCHTALCSQAHDRPLTAGIRRPTDETAGETNSGRGGQSLPFGCQQSIDPMLRLRVLTMTGQGRRALPRFLRVRAAPSSRLPRSANPTAHLTATGQGLRPQRGCPRPSVALLPARPGDPPPALRPSAREAPRRGRVASRPRWGGLISKGERP